MSKKGRGSSSELLTVVNGIQLSSVRWFDTKSVNVLSSFAGCLPVGKAKRWFRNEMVFKEIDRPHVIEVYNKHMGGVDLLDSFIGLYRNYRLRSEKWYHRILFHFIDSTIVNAWLLYRRALAQKNITVNILHLVDFKASVAQSLCKRQKHDRKWGRRSNELQRRLDVKIPRSGAPNPQIDVRTDAVAHWPVFGESRQRCRVPNCKGITETRCEKCDIPLCLTKKRNCFKFFHTN